MCTVRNPNIKVEFLLKLPTLLIVCLAGRVDRFFPSQKKKTGSRYLYRIRSYNGTKLWDSGCDYAKKCPEHLLRCLTRYVFVDIV